jgi:hypothetical protein
VRWLISVAAFTACLLVGALWVRSYWWADEIVLRRSPAALITCQSMQGSMRFVAYPRPLFTGIRKLNFESRPAAALNEKFEPDLYGNLRRVRLDRWPLIVPHWAWMLATGLLAAGPWVRWRFSVRGVLVLMAFIAAMFAILVLE